MALNTKPGQRLVARETASLTGNMVVIGGLGGSFPSAPRVGRVEINDAKGTWLTVENIALDWSPLALLHGDAQVERLSVGTVSLTRLPISGATSSSSNNSFSLPVRVDVATLSVARVALAAAVAGTPALVSLTGEAHLASLAQGSASLDITQLDGPGRYTLSGTIDAARLAAHIALDEPTQGLLSGLAQMPDLGALSLRADLDGPRAADALQLTLSAGPLRAHAAGTIDLDRRSADLDVSANAPAMQPRPDISWQSVALDAHVHGPFTRPDAAGNLQIAQLAAAGVSVGRLSAKLSGNAGQVSLDALAEALHIPGPRPDLLAAAPLHLSAHMQLDAPDRPLAFTLDHPLLTATGQVTTATAWGGRVAVSLPDLTPLAAIGGVALQGRSRLELKASMKDGTTTAELDGGVDVSGGMAPIPGLLGEATIGVSAALHGQDVTISRLDVAGRTLKLQASGGLSPGRVNADWTVALSDLAVLAPTIAGTLQAQGHLDGPADNLAAQAQLSGDVTVAGHRGPLQASLTAGGLPATPSGHLLATGSLDNAPLSLDVGAQRAADGALAISIARTDWKSAHVQGDLTLAPGARLPLGKLSLRMSRLADLRPLIGQDITGAVELTAELARPDLLRLQLTATHAGLPGSAEIGTARLSGEVHDPATRPVVDAALSLDGLQAGALSGNARLQLRGPQDALALRLDAGLHGLAGADATLATAATIDAVKRQISVASLQAGWKTLTARLLGPARIDLANGLSVDHLRLGVGQSELDLSGRAEPTLDLTASVRHVTPELAKLFVPEVQADGNLQADAHLTGTAARPTGTVRVVAAGLHMRTGPGRALPAASLTASADLHGTAARLDFRLTAGTTQVSLTGEAPLSTAGALDLHASGALNLALLDPILVAQGRRLQGQVSLDAAATGSIAAPRLGGSLQVSGGDFQDFAQGMHLTAMQGTLTAAGDTIRITRFVAHAGAGTITAAGSIGALAPGLPVDITITARNAKPLASDLITAVLDADLTLKGQAGKGQASEQLAAAGSVRIRSANIQVPETLPTSIAELNVRAPGQKPAPPAAPGPDIALNLDLTAQQIFVRGRGLDAELGGRMQLGGSAAAPAPEGGFQMRRGNFALAGVTLTFTTGDITFNGGNKIDPALDFVANSASSSVTATLTIGGYASAPKITLSSVPQLPQDEVLSYLLFRTSTASLSPFQLAEIAAALAQISGVTGGVGDPLARARKLLGLDQLNVGSNSTGSPTLDAGRYVARGVYVGAVQGLGGNAGTQATVQIDITKGLKLETDAGSGAGANSIGLKYQFEY